VLGERDQPDVAGDCSFSTKAVRSVATRSGCSHSTRWPVPSYTTSRDPPKLIVWGDRDELLKREDQEALSAAIPVIHQRRRHLRESAVNR
jgi:hypothetical protein